MTVNEAIAMARKMRPSSLDDEALASMLVKIDDEMAEMMEVSPNDPSLYPEYDYELKMESPHDDIYPLYLSAQIDFYNQETALYQNDAIIFNNALADAKADYRRHNRPTRERNWRV